MHLHSYCIIRSSQRYIYRKCAHFHTYIQRNIYAYIYSYNHWGGGDCYNFPKDRRAHSYVFFCLFNYLPKTLYTVHCWAVFILAGWFVYRSGFRRMRPIGEAQAADREGLTACARVLCLLMGRQGQQGWTSHQPCTVPQSRLLHFSYSSYSCFLLLLLHLHNVVYIDMKLLGIHMNNTKNWRLFLCYKRNIILNTFIWYKPLLRIKF